MLLSFTKMHGLGNDFVVIDATVRPCELSQDQIRSIADRRYGVGCDQLLLIEPASKSGVDFNYRIFNADGSVAQQCGNGVRCAARFVRDKGLSSKQELQMLAAATVVVAVRFEENGLVRVDMGVPDFEPASLPFNVAVRQRYYAIDLNGTGLSIGAVFLGNPHAVIEVDELDRVSVADIGTRLESHPLFPERVNVGFMQIVDRERIRLRVYERGVAETPACGSGACAAMAIGRDRGLLNECVTVSLPGGELVIRWAGEGDVFSMIGPTTTVFEGEIEL